MRGGSISNVAIFIFMLLIIIGASILILVVYFHGSTNRSYIRGPSVDYKPVNTFSSSFPPCFEISTDAKNIYKIMKNAKIETKYSRLLDAYTLALCQQNDFKTSCELDTLNQRIVTLNSWNANQYDNNAINIVNSVTKLTNNKIGQFLVQICYICERQIELINNDDNIMREDKIQITGFNSQFYRHHFDAISKGCPKFA